MANKPTPSENTHIYSHPSFVSAYSLKQRHKITFPDQGRTKQSFKDECDINNIMRRFETTGEITHLSRRSPIFADFPEMDFAEAMAVVVKAREDFATLPSEVRERFAHDPGRLLEFLQDPANREEGIRLGLIRKPEPEPPAAPAAPQPGPASS